MVPRNKQYSSSFWMKLDHKFTNGNSQSAAGVSERKHRSYNSSPADVLRYNKNSPFHMMISIEGDVDVDPGSKFARKVLTGLPQQKMMVVTFETN